MWYIFLVNQVSLCFCTTCVHIWLFFFCYTRISAHWLCLYFFATQKMNPCLAQYINCIVWDNKKKGKVSKLGVGVVQWWTPPVSTLHPLALSLALLSPLGCYWSDLLLSQLEPWFMLFRLALTHHTQTQLSHALRYLSVHLSLPALPLSALRQVNLLFI